VAVEAPERRGRRIAARKFAARLPQSRLSPLCLSQTSTLSMAPSPLKVALESWEGWADLGDWVNVGRVAGGTRSYRRLSFFGGAILDGTEGGCDGAGKTGLATPFRLT